MLLTREQLQERLMALHQASLELVIDKGVHSPWTREYANARTFFWC